MINIRGNNLNNPVNTTRKAHAAKVLVIPSLSPFSHNLRESEFPSQNPLVFDGRVALRSALRRDVFKGWANESESWATSLYLYDVYSGAGTLASTQWNQDKFTSWVAEAGACSSRGDFALVYRSSSCTSTDAVWLLSFTSAQLVYVMLPISFEKYSSLAGSYLFARLHKMSLDTIFLERLSAERSCFREALMNVILDNIAKKMLQIIGNCPCADDSSINGRSWPFSGRKIWLPPKWLREEARVISLANSTHECMWNRYRQKKGEKHGAGK